MPNRAVIALAVAALVVLGADVTVVATRRGGPPGGGGAGGAGGAGDGPGRPASTDDLERVLPGLMAFVEQARGLRFRDRPRVELLPDEEFERRLLEDDVDEESLADEEAYLGLLRALGLIEGEVDLEDVDEEQAGGIVGFYDPREDTLFVRGRQITPYVSEVIVHELTHALEDQHFDLDRDEVIDDAGAAFAALVEGSALVVEERWFRSRPRLEQEEIEAIEGTGPDGALEDEDLPYPDVFDALLSFPYEVGPRFVEHLLEAGRQARLDEAFRTPPATSEQVLHPDRFLAGEGARTVADPSPDGPEVQRGSLGELGLILALGSRLDRSVAGRAAAGWGGDRYVVWNDRSRTCLRWSLVMDTPRDTDEVVAALRAWVARRPGASVRGVDPVVLTSCG